MRKKGLQYVILVVLATLAVARTGAVITNAGLPWYNTLTLPAWTPGSTVISVAWTIIFIAAALSAILAVSAKQSVSSQWLIIILFIINALLNVGWTYAFFGMHELYLAVWVARMLVLSVLTIILTVWPHFKISALLLVPYFAWVVFASYLTSAIWALNLIA